MSDEAKASDKDDWGVVQGHDTVERALRERWDDPKAGEKDPLVVIHYRNCISPVMVSWLTATFIAAWERCRKGAARAANVAVPNIRILLWGGGDDELPLGRTTRGWEEKSVLSIGWWKEWVNHADLVSIIRILYGEEQLPGDFGRVLQFVFGWCERVYGDQQAHNLQIAYDALLKEEAEFVGPDGKMMRAVGLPAPARALAGVALERGAALLIFREDSGRVALDWNTKFNAADTKTVARVVGIEERHAHDRGAGALTFDEIVKIASKVLNPASWEPGFAHRCKMGICNSGRNGNPICPRAIWHLRKCDECRFEFEASPVRVQPMAPVAVSVPKSEEEKAPAPASVVKPTQAIDERSQTEAPASLQVMDVAPSP